MQQSDWEKEQVWERQWWGKCLNTFGEEAKQITYAHRMGLINEPQNGQWPVYDMKGKSVLDIGGGPNSILLKTINLSKQSGVVDPCPYPEWVKARYREANILFSSVMAEDLATYVGYNWDEAWIYNVLQHVKDPELVVKNALKQAKVVRIFEWLDAGVSEGHPHNLNQEDLRLWLGSPDGQVELLKGENGCNGWAFYGVFKGKQ